MDDRIIRITNMKQAIDEFIKAYDILNNKSLALDKLVQARIIPLIANKDIPGLHDLVDGLPRGYRNARRIYEAMEIIREDSKMKISQKKNCERCRAIGQSQGQLANCSLGYNNMGKYIPNMGIYEIKPQEPCPKPMTISSFIIAGKTYKKEQK